MIGSYTIFDLNIYVQILNVPNYDILHRVELADPR